MTRRAARVREVIHSLLKPGMRLTEPPEGNTHRPMTIGKGLAQDLSYIFLEDDCTRVKLVNDSRSQLQVIVCLEPARATKATYTSFPKGEVHI